MITVLGIGPGDPKLRLAGTTEYLKRADTVVGSRRQLAAFPDLPKEKQKQWLRLSKLKNYLLKNKQKNIVLLASGDPLLYGIGSWVVKNFPADEIKIISGISSIQYMFHQLRLSMNDCYLTSSHGRQPDFDFLLKHKKVAMVTDAHIGPYEIAQAIKKRGLHRQIYIGEHLSYPDERIVKRDEKTVVKRKYQMNVVIITNA